MNVTLFIIYALKAKNKTPLDKEIKQTHFRIFNEKAVSDLKQILIYNAVHF